MRGPTEKARTSDPIPADPFHHQALKPSVNPSDVAPTVELAPMLAARNVEKIRPAPSRRPPTKKSLAPARRPTHSPIETKTRGVREEEREGQLLQVPRSRIAGDPRGRAHGPDDGVRHGVGSERAELIHVGCAGTRTRRKREDRIAVVREM